MHVTRMADWKQITARIRRARTGKDPATQLSNLYQKTRDAMVAFELARFFEVGGQNAEAAKWYSTAAERFRRVDWKTKAQEAAARLAGPSGEPSAAPSDDFQLTSPAAAATEPGLPFQQTTDTSEAAVPPAEEAADSPASPAPVAPRPVSTRRRGRRGGRNRHRPGAATRSAPLPAAPETATLSTHQPPSPVDVAPEPRFGRVSESFSAPRVPLEPSAESISPSLRGRYGDPGLSSRLSLLEMQFRRLLSCSPLKLDSAERAPAGPGVLLLSDSDLTTNYYVEACQTLRIAIANLLKGGASRRGGDSLKPQLADHLGIAESRVSKYLAEHCVVRYLQLDDDASHFAHFVIAVLRPTLNT